VPYSSQEDAVKIDEIISRFDSIRNAIRGKVNIKEFIDAGRKF
jgi:hypothetical protein